MYSIKQLEYVLACLDATTRAAWDFYASETVTFHGQAQMMGPAGVPGRDTGATLCSWTVNLAGGKAD